MKKFINLTGHLINFNDGRAFPPDTTKEAAAKVKATFSPFVDDVAEQVFGPVENLPPPQPDTVYIIGGIVLQAVKAMGRTDCVAPATGHPEAKRSANNAIVLSVPGWVR